MSTLNIGATVIHLGTLSPAVNQQITQAVAASAASAYVANLFTAGVTDLGSIIDAPMQTFDMGSLT